MDNVWFCKVLLLFQVESNADLGLKRHSCAFVTVMEGYSGPQRQGKLYRLLIALIVLIYFILHILLCNFSCFCSLVGSMWPENYIRTQHAVTSSVCCAHYFILGETCTCSCWWHWDHSVNHAQGEQGLWWCIMMIMRHKDGRWRRQSLVVHQQCCHEVGDTPINCLSSNCKFKFYINDS
jgi:hypothetical protein